MFLKYLNKQKIYLDIRFFCIFEILKFCILIFYINTFLISVYLIYCLSMYLYLVYIMRILLYKYKRKKKH